jgi:hypothetical protein
MVNAQALCGSASLREKKIMRQPITCLSRKYKIERRDAATLRILYKIKTSNG